MILAAPLVIPFAKAVGLSVGTLGMAALADQVNDYIQDNPEESMKILSTIIPGVGIGQIFMSKEDKISLEDLDEMTDEEAQDLSKEEKAELMKQAGKSGGKNKRQTMIDLSEKLGLSGEGREKQDIEYEVDERYDEGGVEDAPKPKFDYTKFFRKRRADGGSIGIEVLFREKKNLGGLLTGQAKSIYDFMSAAGYFTEDEIRNAIINAGYEIPKATTTTTTTTPVINTAPNIINQGGGGKDDGSNVPTDPYAGLGYSSANFGLGQGINKDAVMDYEADAYNIGRTPLGQLSRFGVGIIEALKNIPTPLNLVRKGIEFAKQKQIEKQIQEEAAARDLAREIQEQNRANKEGGYQSDFAQDKDFMEGPPGGDTGLDPSDRGGSDTMGSFKKGGLASMFVEKK